MVLAGSNLMSARRRSNGEGSIFQEKSGRYRISVTRWEGEKRVRKTRTAWKKADAVAILAELRNTTTDTTGNITVARFLCQWLKTVVSQKAANTLDSYTLAVNNHINPKLGTIRLDRLTPANIQAWLSAMSTNKTGSRTRANAYAVFRSAIEHAIDINLIAKSPFARIGKPSHETEPINPFTLDEAREILEDSKGERWHAAYQLAFTAGLRQGEIFGLQWGRIDFEKSTVRIDQQVICIGGKTNLAKPKTKASIRTIEITPACRQALFEHQKQFGSNNLVFTAPQGGLIGRSTFRTRVWIPQLKRLLLTHRGFHHTRHTYATIALGAGVPVTVVSKTLGHAKVEITLNVYSHVLESHRTEATARIESLFNPMDTTLPPS
jgi:integrase